MQGSLKKKLVFNIYMYVYVKFCNVKSELFSYTHISRINIIYNTYNNTYNNNNKYWCSKYKTFLTADDSITYGLYSC